MMGRVILLGCMVLAGAPAWGQPARPQPARPTAPAPAPAPPRQSDEQMLADRMLTQMGRDKLVDQVMGALKASTIEQLRTAQVGSQAEEIWSTYLGPEFQRRTPELLAGFQDTLIGHLSAAEMRLLLEGPEGTARQAALAKMPAVPGHFNVAAQAWGKRVGADAFRKNKDELAKLGLKLGDD